MKDYEFTLIFSLPDQNDEPSNYLEVLGAAGCTDATIGVGVAGRIAMNFAAPPRTPMRRYPQPFKMC